MATMSDNALVALDKNRIVDLMRRCVELLDIVLKFFFKCQREQVEDY